VIASIASSAGSVVVTKVREESSNLILTMAWSMMWGALFVAAFSLATGQQFVLPSRASYFGGLLYLSLFGSVIAFFAYFTLIDRIGSQKAVYTTVISPVVSVLLSIRLEHFRPGLVEWLGIVVCLASVAWALRAPSPKPAESINVNNLLETP
jgi:drug/metabolite transporter (DMT)-like permease